MKNQEKFGIITNISQVELIVYDFDGVMTDNKVFIDQFGNETVQVNREDGFGVSEIKKMGLKQIIISTEVNPVVVRRAEKLRIDCINGVSDKERELRLYCQKKNIKLKNVVYIGNDLNDLCVMKTVGWPFCPSDAYKSIKKIAKYVLIKRGGEGIVRELLELIKKNREE